MDASGNFESITYEVDDDNQEIVVCLPHAKHYKTIMVLESLEVYLDHDNLFSRINMSEQNIALLELEAFATDTALGNSLVEVADENAQRIIGAMVTSNLDHKNYTVIY